MRVKDFNPLKNSGCDQHCSCIELKAENRDTAIQHAHEALNSSRGVNRYVLYKEYERVLPEVVGHIS